MSAAFAQKGALELASVELYGVKAAGLAALPSGWTPPFVAFPTATTGRIDGDPTLLDDIGAALESLSPGSDGVIVRSSSVGENLMKRGSLDSVRCSSDPAEVRRAMSTISLRAGQNGVSQLGYVIHSWIPARATGHLSNERRVSERGTRWRWELETGEADSRHDYLRVDSDVKTVGDLGCTNPADLTGALRSVARRVWERHERVHLEWLWDGRRIWVIQRDVDETPEGRPPGSEWKDGAARPLGKELRLFGSAAHAGDDFPKATHVQTFRQAGLPFGDVRVVSGSVTMKRLAEGKVSRELRRDLTDLVDEPVVVRTDVRTSRNRPMLLLRRTDACESYVEIERFLKETASQLIADGVAPNDIAFLVHRFLLAEAGAFAYARPGGTGVLIDSTWGLPDSLLYHSHDSYEVELGTGVMRSHLRCKNEYIDIDADGKWRSKAAGRPWDWKPACTAEVAREVARQAQLVADTAGFDVEVMFFIFAGGKPSSVLPWFFSEPERDLEEIQESPGFYVGRRIRISDESDLQRMKAEVERDAGSDRRLSIQFVPAFERLRDRDFVREVGEFASDHHVPVDLEGSHLAHSYYLLQSTGASVRCVDVWQRRGRRRTFGGKLVRDLIPIRIARHGETATTHTVTKKDLAALIKAKAIEEAVEYYWSQGQAEGVEELADLLELIRAGATALDVDMENIEKIAKRKRIERGGFEKGIVLVETEEGMDLGQDESGDRGSLLAPETESLRRPAPRRIHRMPDRRLVLPIAPPTGWVRREPRVVPLDATEEAVVTYGDATIQVQVRPRRGEVGPDQLALPALPEEP